MAACPSPRAAFSRDCPLGLGMAASAVARRRCVRQCLAMTSRESWHNGLCRLHHGMHIGHGSCQCRLQSLQAATGQLRRFQMRYCGGRARQPQGKGGALVKRVIHGAAIDLGHHLALGQRLASGQAAAGATRQNGFDKDAGTGIEPLTRGVECCLIDHRVTSVVALGAGRAHLA